MVEGQCLGVEGHVVLCGGKHEGGKTTSAAAKVLAMETVEKRGGAGGYLNAMMSAEEF